MGGRGGRWSWEGGAEVKVEGYACCVGEEGGEVYDHGVREAEERKSNTNVHV